MVLGGCWYFERIERDVSSVWYFLYKSRCYTSAFIEGEALALLDILIKDCVDLIFGRSGRTGEILGEITFLAISEAGA